MDLCQLILLEEHEQSSDNIIEYKLYIEYLLKVKIDISSDVAVLPLRIDHTNTLAHI